MIDSPTARQSSCQSSTIPFKIAESALEKLGGRNLYSVERTTDHKYWNGHALPDLLNAWDFAFDLKRSRTEYEE